MDIIQCNLLVKKKRKWKSRWVVLRRVNPASERINLYIYKNHLSAISKQKEKLFFPLREYCGVESIDKENKLPKLVIITATQPLSLRFQSKEDRDHWVDTIVTEGNFGEDVTFDGVVPSKQPLRSCQVTLHIYRDFFSLVRKQNCRCLGRWNFEQLFNYGTVDGGFVFRVESEGESEKGAEPESFYLLTSLEKQINRTFDTVYKTARHMYGSAEGLQRSPKSNSSGVPRPRSMSEPSGFKRFMHRLSFRRKSRRPKTSKSGADKHRGMADRSPTSPDGFNVYQHGRPVAAQPLENKLESPTQTERRSSENSSGGASAAELSPSRLKVSSSGDGSSDLVKDFVNGTRQAVTNEGGVSLENGINNKRELVREAEHNVENNAMKGGRETKQPFSQPAASTQQFLTPQAPMDSEELKIWQRRSALMMNDDMNVDDMIKQGFIKSKSRERPSSVGDPLAGGRLFNNNGVDAFKGAGEGTGIGIQVRRNTSSVGGKRPMLTIAIASSACSEPSLSRPEYDHYQSGNVQYVNLPAEPIKNKHIDKLKVGEWARYDSDENVYHHLAAVVGSPGYENLPDQSISRSITSLDKSYENFPGMTLGHSSYENVAAGRGTMHYVNVEGAKEKQSVNYIRVAGSSPPTPISKNSGYSFSSRKKDSNYTVIDLEKTQKLLEMTKQTKKPVERAKKS